MIDLKEIHPLTDFTRNTKMVIGRLKRTKKPMVLTVNGKAEVIVQDATSYQKLLAHIEHLETLQGIREGLESVRQGKGTEARKFFAELRQELGIPEMKTKK